MLKYLKFGFGRATDYANEAIRHQMLGREKAVSMVERLDGSCSPEAIESFCRYIGICEAEFWEVVLAATNEQLFDKKAPGRPRPRFTVGRGI